MLLLFLFLRADLPYYHYVFHHFHGYFSAKFIPKNFGKGEKLAKKLQNSNDEKIKIIIQREQRDFDPNLAYI